MKIARTDAGYVLPAFHSDMYDLGVDLQAFEAVNHLDTGILELLGPLDVGFFVETGKQFDDYGDFLSVTGCPYQRTHHF